jgi:hypothetical protein
MKPIFSNKLLSSLSILFLFFIAGCDRNQCEDIICPINQECNRGQCFCINGYEGVNCQDLAYLKYIGSYNVSESCQGGPPFGIFSGTIAVTGNAINQLIFLNFLNSGQNAFAYIGTDANNNANYLRIPSQNLGGSAFTVAGEGTYLDFGGFNRIQLDLQITQAGTARFCTITYL